MSDFINFLADNRAEVLQQLLEHIELTFISLAIATFAGVLLGIISAKYSSFSKPILGVVNVIQTIPSLALLGFLLPLLGIGLVPAIVALFLYALLPIVRNTYTGITEVDKSVREAATAMGLTSKQVLFKVELPLALPYIMAGIKTASVINVGVATLSAFIAAGGLGKFILQGIQLNNTNMILAGAIPASLLALVLDFSLGTLGRRRIKTIKITLIIFASILGLYLLYKMIPVKAEAEQSQTLKGGFLSEFIHREDGLKGLFATYDFELPYVEMDVGLLYQALRIGEVDLISGFSTDGRIKAYNLTVLADDLRYFPPYQAAAMIRQETLAQYPDLLSVLNLLEDQLSDSTMTALNYEVDELGKIPAEVALSFLESTSFFKAKKVPGTSNGRKLVIGSKAFTENYILAHIFRYLIEANTTYKVELKLGFGGTKLLMDAMKRGALDLYPEYTGTALLLLLQNNDEKVRQLIKSPKDVYEYVLTSSEEQFGFSWSRPLGFNNTFAMLMRTADAKQRNIQTMSDLAELIEP